MPLQRRLQHLHELACPLACQLCEAVHLSMHASPGHCLEADCHRLACCWDLWITLDITESNLRRDALSGHRPATLECRCHRSF